MKQPKITKLKMQVTTCKRNTKPVSTNITIALNSQEVAENYAHAIGAKLKEFEAHILQSISPQNAQVAEQQTAPTQPMYKY